MYFTRRQLEVLDFIRRFLAEHRISPTLDEMAAHFRVSRITIHEHVKALETKGVLHRTPNRARSIELADTPDEPADAPLSIPILGLVRAGSPAEPYEVPEEFDVSAWLADTGSLHMLRVTGDSMIEDHIADGDLVLVDRRRIPRDGDIVVATTPDGSATLKRIYREAGRVRLQPSNASMEPIYVETADVRGVVVGLVRRF